MSDQLTETKQLVLDAFAILYGDDAPSPHEAGHFLAFAAKKLACALPQRDSVYDPELDGPPLSPEAIKAAAIEVRFFLEMISDLFGDSSDPDWTGDQLAVVGTLTKRPPEKIDRRKIMPAARRRLAAAEKVYELMAEQYVITGKVPKQEAAVVAVVAMNDQFGLPRSKVMQGLKELREKEEGSFLFMAWSPTDTDGCPLELSQKQRRTLAANCLVRKAVEKEWIKGNPGWKFLYVVPGSALEKQLLMQNGPHDPA